MIFKGWEGSNQADAIWMFIRKRQVGEKNCVTVRSVFIE